MQPQNYSNHSRYYTPHHFVFYPVVTFFFAIAVYKSCTDAANGFLWLMVAAAFLILALLSFMMRQHYALNNQNRIVRLEMRLRYYVLTQKRLDLLENKLSLSQLFALRFASDEELPALVDRAVNENLSGDAIKRAIKSWQPDLMRV